MFCVWENLKEFWGHGFWFLKKFEKILEGSVLFLKEFEKNPGELPVFDLFKSFKESKYDHPPRFFKMLWKAKHLDP